MTRTAFQREQGSCSVEEELHRGELGGTGPVRAAGAAIQVTDAMMVRLEKVGLVPQTGRGTVNRTVQSLVCGE